MINQELEKQFIAYLDDIKLSGEQKGEVMGHILLSVTALLAAAVNATITDEELSKIDTVKTELYQKALVYALYEKKTGKQIQDVSDELQEKLYKSILSLKDKPQEADKLFSVIKAISQ